MAYALGVKALKRLCTEQSALAWQRAKLSPPLFKPYEQPVFTWVQAHVKLHHALPKVETLQTQFPDIESVDTPEPASYYVHHLEQQFIYETLSKANIATQAVLKADQAATATAVETMRASLRAITEQQYRARILDVGKEAAELLIKAYYQTATADYVAACGWPYLDGQTGGVMPGDVVSFVGRPAIGKTWMMVWSALHNWHVRKLHTLFVSMEMMILPITQRIATIYTHQNIGQLKMSGYSNVTMQKFLHGLKAMGQEKAKLYVVDGNLAADVEELFALAETLNCRVIVIDGAYLLRHRNARLDRFTRAAENVELIKRYCTDTERIAFCSWQFNREASKKQKKGKGDHGDLEDIGYSDAIGQISSIALSLFQEESIETIKARKIQVMKGRNGEVGQFSIAWDFTGMNFHQTDPPIGAEVETENDPDFELEGL